MRSKSILTEAKQISRAVALIGLGARLQVLESETDLSYERLLRLYKEVAGKSPSKGQLPFSTDWFMTWQPNIHASLFLNIHEYLNKSSELDEIDAVIKGYQLYQEETSAQGLEALLSVTRAWRLVKFVDNGMLTMTKCSKCGGSSSPIRTRSPDTTSAPCATRRRVPARARRPARSACTSSPNPRPAIQVAGQPAERQGSPFISCLSPPAHHCALNAGPSGPAFLFRPQFRPSCGDRRGPAAANSRHIGDRR
jgi:flagellar transcriptional activator FlhC